MYKNYLLGNKNEMVKSQNYFSSIQNSFLIFIAFRRTTRPPPTTQNVDKESPHNPSKRRYLFTEDQRRVLKQTFENEQYPNQSQIRTTCR